MNKKEKELLEQNEFLKDLLEGFKDIKAGRLRVLK